MRAGLTHRRAIIVGAGQSGLAVAAALAAEALRPQHEFVVIDAASTGQRSWLPAAAGKPAPPPIRARATTVLTATGIITVAPGVGGRKGSSVTSSTSDTKNLFLIAGLMTGLSAALANAGGAADGS